MLIEVNCESDFVARTDDFQELVKDLAMQVAAADPQFVRKEDVTAAALDKETDIQRARALAEGKPEKMARQDRRGPPGQILRRGLPATSSRSSRKTPTTIADVIKTKIAKLGENISVSRFVRFKVGDTAAAEETAGE